MVSLSLAQSGGPRLLWLDAARGIAAIAVMCYHFDELLQLRPLLKSAYLAVDLFFMMSGFVLSQSYESKMRSGRLSVRMYMVSRLIRLYPTYLVATGLGLSYYVSKVALRTDDAPAVADLLYILCSNLLFVPVTTTALVPQGMFPFAPTSWSLATEVVASLLYGFVLARATNRTLLMLIALFGCVFLGCVVAYRDFDLGWHITSFVPGIFRTLFEFTIGITLYRLSTNSAARRFLKPAVLLIAVTAVLVFFASDVIVYTGLCVLVLFPAFILSAEGHRIQGLLSTVCHELGRLSYPVYLLHAPVLLWAAGAYKMVAKQDALALHVRWLGCAMIVGTLVLSYIVARWIDEPVRTWLNGRVRARGSAITPASAEVLM